MGINNFKVMPRKNKKELLQQLEVEGKGGEGNE